VRAAYEAFNRRDLAALLALMDPEVRFTTRFVERSDTTATMASARGRRTGKTEL
jgi:ketosteroid isomerase-like protein